VFALDAIKQFQEKQSEPQGSAMPFQLLSGKHTVRSCRVLAATRMPDCPFSVFDTVPKGQAKVACDATWKLM
jgi:hypothetical protein